MAPRPLSPSPGGAVPPAWAPSCPALPGRSLHTANGDRVHAHEYNLDVLYGRPIRHRPTLAAPAPSPTPTPANG
ncbi:MAG: hypothetical protein HY906_24270 [Deltaproteobacteria bacterium]|nr:hypothetical protein [Deltaproteobacteria bacterium]